MHETTRTPPLDVIISASLGATDSPGWTGNLCQIKMGLCMITFGEKINLLYVHYTERGEDA